MSVKLEVGKFYRTRDGRKVGPLSPWQGKDDPWPFSAVYGECSRASFSASGVACDGPWPEGLKPDLDIIAEWTDEAAAATSANRYARTINGATVDVYDILRAFNVTCPATQHAIKKLLLPGQRGGKSVTQDLREALASVQRAIEMAGE